MCESVLICMPGHESTVVVTLLLEERTFARKVLRIKFPSASLMKDWNLRHTCCHCIRYMSACHFCYMQVYYVCSNSWWSYRFRCTLWINKAFSGCFIVGVILPLSYFLSLKSIIPLIDVQHYPQQHNTHSNIKGIVTSRGVKGMANCGGLIHVVVVEIWNKKCWSLLMRVLLWPCKWFR